jgi:hypothetical protein
MNTIDEVTLARALSRIADAVITAGSPKVEYLTPSYHPWRMMAHVRLFGRVVTKHIEIPDAALAVAAPGEGVELSAYYRYKAVREAVIDILHLIAAEGAKSNSPPPQPTERGPHALHF